MISVTSLIPRNSTSDQDPQFQTLRKTPSITEENHVA
jgi:hypothetical protein